MIRSRRSRAVIPTHLIPVQRWIRWQTRQEQTGHSPITQAAIGILITAAALWLTTAVVPGIRIESSVPSFLIVAAVFGLVNVFVRPIVKLLSLPATILTLGLFTFVVNALMLMLTAWLVGNAMSIEGEGLTKLWWAIVGSVVISIATMVIGWIMPDKD
jgi:putative membrane protein